MNYQRNRDRTKGPFPGGKSISIRQEIFSIGNTLSHRKYQLDTTNRQVLWLIKSSKGFKDSRGSAIPIGGPTAGGRESWDSRDSGIGRINS
jgi:hypothetical protein